MKRQWLKDWPWQTVVVINAGLCKEKKESASQLELSLRETLDICRRCHKLAPFCFYNGNTFAAIGRTIILDILQKLPPVQAHTLRSVVGHYIAGTAGADELAKVLEDLE